MKNRLNLKIRLNLKLKTILIFIGVALCPLIISTYINYIGQRNDNSKLSSDILQILREEKTIQVKDFYKNLEGNLKNLSKNMDNLISFEFVTKDYTDNILLLDKNYNVLYSKNSIESNSVESLKNVSFTSPIYIDGFKAFEERAFQYIYYKTSNNDKVSYIILELNNKFLKESFSNMNMDFDYEILGEDYKVISSKDKNILYKTKIDTISKDMLDGNTKVMDFQGKRYAYSFIDIGDNPLYISIYQDISLINSNQSGFIKTFYFSLIITFLLVLFIALKYFKMLQREVFTLPINQDYNKGCISTSSLKLQVKDSIEVLDKVIDDIQSINNNKEKLGELLYNLIEKESDLNEENWYKK